MNINTHAEFFTTPIKPDTMHLAGIELEMARWSNTLWYRNSGNRHGFFWLSYDDAPKCSIVAFDTWTTFLALYDKATPTTAGNLPWMCQTGVDTVKIRATFATLSPAKLTYRAFTDGLLATTTVVYSSDSEPSIGVDFMSGAIPGQWYKYRTTTLEFSISPDIPANRLIKIGFQASNYSELGNENNITNTAHPVYLMSAFVADYIGEL